MTHTVLKIESSARFEGSFSRRLTDAIAAKLAAREPGAQIKDRDLAKTPPSLVTQDWVTASFSPLDHHTDQQKDILAESETLIDELKAADTVIFGVPMYNFGIPASLKAWVDLITRPGLTFNYGPQGPVGLLSGTKAIIAMTSGGVESGSEMDFATPHLRLLLNFIGITDVQVIAADKLVQDESRFDAAIEQIGATL